MSRPCASPRSNRFQCRSSAGVTFSIAGRQSRVSPAEISVNAPCRTKQIVGPAWVCQGRLLPSGWIPSVRVNPATLAVLNVRLRPMAAPEIRCYSKQGGRSGAQPSPHLRPLARYKTALQVQDDSRATTYALTMRPLTLLTAATLALLACGDDSTGSNGNPPAHRRHHGRQQLFRSRHVRRHRGSDRDLGLGDGRGDAQYRLRGRCPRFGQSILRNVHSARSRHPAPIPTTAAFMAPRASA